MYPVYAVFIKIILLYGRIEMVYFLVFMNRLALVSTYPLYILSYLHVGGSSQ